MRKAKIKRATKETDISLELNLDGEGSYKIDTGIHFFDHMLSLFAKHGLFNLRLKAVGDIDVDYHHTVEDVGIVLGDALKKSLGNMNGIRRYGLAITPMDETLCSVAIDVSGRPYLIYNVNLPKKARIKNFDPDLIEDFLRAFVMHGGITLHVNIVYGRNVHHIIEAVFKAVARALREAVIIDPRVKGAPSTKGGM